MVLARWVRFAAAGVTFLALPASCGGIARVSGSGTGGGANSSGGADSADAGAGARRTDTPAERARACRLYFASMFSPPCSTPELPSSELARLEALFEESCVGEFDLPGNANTAEALLACANALRLDVCKLGNEPPRECDFRGSLQAGAPCIAASQCRSGTCSGGGGAGKNPWTAQTTTCGTCTDVGARIGEPCLGRGCEKGASCGTTPSGPPGSPVCRATTEGDVDEPCDHETHLCETGLFCNDSRSRCDRFPVLDEPCPSDLCAPPLVCRLGPIATGGRADPTCGPPGNSGDDCSRAVGRACAPGLWCVWDNGLSVNRCVPLSWAQPGELCDDTHRCLVGDCVDVSGRPASPGTCPRTVPDGQPCTSDIECDTLSYCLKPSAADDVATGVCGPISRLACAH